MTAVAIKTSPQFEEKFTSYPDHIQKKMLHLRDLVHQVAKDIPMSELEETLKWGEPSFITKRGSTLRMDWKPKSPDRYAMYFSCSSRLVETFRMVFGDALTYEGKRAIVFDLDAPISDDILKRCIKATLLYHEVKKDVKLGL